MRSNPDRIMCKVRSCSHIFCKHEMHTCLFGKEQWRRGGRQAHGGFDAGRCDGRIWQSIRVYHDQVETNCRDGHRCGMGIVSGDVAKCECEPAAPVTTHEVRKIVSTARRGRGSPLANGAAKLQVLNLEAETKVCLNKGDVSKFKVKYHSADGKKVTALAFKLQFDARFFSLKSAKVSPNQHCSLSGSASASSILSSNQQTSIPYVCISPTGSKVVPADDAGVLEVELVAKGGYEGVTTVGIVPNPMLHGVGYRYEAAAPIQLRYGHCGPSSWTVRPVAHQTSYTMVGDKLQWTKASKQHFWTNDHGEHRGEDGQMKSGELTAAQARAVLGETAVSAAAANL
jgi:hypothetical protein